MRTAAELSETDEPAWANVTSWLAASPHGAVVLPVTKAASKDTLYRLQVSTRSTLGALAWNCGGIKVDHSWLRLLGGGTPGLVDIATASGMGEPGPSSSPPHYLIVAFDVLGGTFAINGGGLPGKPGDVAYFGPDTLDWMTLGMGHSTFINWALTGDTDAFYADLRWPGWEKEISFLNLDEGLSVYPPLWSSQATGSLAATKRSAVPWREVLYLQVEHARQLEGVKEGQEVRFTVTE